MESKRKRAPSAESASFVPHTAHEQKKKHGMCIAWQLYVASENDNRIIVYRFL